MGSILKDWLQIGQNAIAAAEQRKAEALEFLDPAAYDDAEHIRLFTEKDCTKQLVPVPGDVAATLLAQSSSRDPIFHAMVEGLKRSGGAAVILWQACDICHICDCEPENGGEKDDDTDGAEG